MKTNASVVVIGGGIMGCSVLYHLAKIGWKDVVLVEKNELTAGSTWHAAGLCTHYAHNPTVMNLRAHSVRLYQSILPQETGQPISFHATGALRVTREEERMDEFRHVAGLGRFVGFEFNLLSPAELKEIYPLVQTDGLLGAIHEPHDGYVDPSQATRALARGARDNGAEIYRHNAVEALRREKGEWVVGTQKGDIRADHIINAAGTWCREIGAMMGLDLPVTPMLHQYIVTGRIDEFAGLGRELPFIRNPDESWYLRQERDGAIIGIYEKDGQPWSIDGVPPGFGAELLPPELARIEKIAMQAIERVPAAGGGGIKEIVNGPITFTPDANPLIGPAFGLTNAWLLTGSSMGVMEGGGAGRFLAEWIAGGEPPMDSLAVDPRRFGDYADRGYRVDKAVECFAAQFAIHYPHEERPAGRPRRVTPMHDRLKSLGAAFGCVYGWERPNWFAHDGAVETTPSFKRPGWFDVVAGECRTVSQRVGFADLSVFSKFEVSGPGAAAFVETLGTNGAPAALGGIVLTFALTPRGGVSAEFIVARIDEQHFYLVSAAAAERINEDLLRAHAAAHREVRIKNRTQEYCVIAVMGPCARSLLSQLTDADLSQAAFPWLSAQPLDIDGIPVNAMRVSYIGESGWELHHEARLQPALFEKLWAAGRELEAGLYGALAMNSMRLEKGYRAWGSELTTERTPLEAGMDAFVKTGNGFRRGFCGERAMLRRQSEPGHWRMHLLELDVTDVDPFYSHAVMQRDKAIGLVTSGSFGHRVNKALALAYFSQPPAGEGLFVSLLGKAVPAKVLEAIPYDPANRRCKR
ncbi:MAG: GcvT family protein [bacterium]